MKRIFTSLSAFLLFSMNTSADFATDDYNQAIRMTVKFFGGQRCGDTHNWMLHENPELQKKYCHTQDKYNGNDVSGGWHDCGDHIKVATTMGYAAVCLLSAYDVWPNAFEDDHSETYGPPNGIADVLDEAKIATDFFIKSLPDDNTFVYYVGNGDFDHQRWVTSSAQSDSSVEKGGDPRPSTASSSAGGAQAANYASALALMAMHYPDQSYKDLCRQTALKLYTYAKAHPENINIPTYYPSPNSEVSDELGLAAILLYRLTGEESYKTEAFNYLKGIWENNAPLAWDTVADILYYYLVKADPNGNNGSGGLIRDFIRKNVEKGIASATSYGIPWNWFTSKWGTNKLASGSAFSAALYVKLIDDGVITGDRGPANTYNQKIVDYMMGNNEFNHPFIHGFKGDMTHRVHHRNAMGRNDNPPTEVKNVAPFLFASGALLGGPVSEGHFDNIIEGGNSFMETESGCDYNGPYVAAIANIVQRLDPKTVSSPVKFSRKNTGSTTVQCRIINGNLIMQNNNSGFSKIEVFNISGKKVLEKSVGNAEVAIYGFSSAKGTYLVRLTGHNAKQEFNVVANR